MKAKNFLVLILPISFLILIFFSACSENSPLNPVNQSINNGIPAEEINWVSWKPEVSDNISAKLGGPQALAKKGLGWEEKIIKREKGGKVGGRSTFGNKVEIPKKAFPERKRLIRVEIACMDEDGVPCGAEVDFLPNQTFDKDVKVTLSWKYLDFDGDPEALLIYWCDTTASFGKGEEDEWVLVLGPYTINYDNQTITFQIDHFTRYAWGL